MSYKTISVFNPQMKYLSHCTWKTASRLLNSKKAIRINATTIRLIETKAEIRKKKRLIIEQSKRICYICNDKIPDSKTATIDHAIPRSRDSRADIYNNMFCCCKRCNSDKRNLKLSEYVDKILKNRNNYNYITDKRLSYLYNFSKHQESEFYKEVNKIPDSMYKNKKEGGKKWL